MKLELYRDSQKDHRWRVRASNGKILAESGEGYRRKRDSIRGLESVVKHFGGSVTPSDFEDEG